MGLFDRLSSFFGSSPDAPNLKNYKTNPFIDKTQGYAGDIDRKTHGLVGAEMDRPSGYTDEEKYQLTKAPQDAINQGAARTLRGMNRNVMSGSKFGSGGSMKDYGRVRSGAAVAGAQVAQRGAAEIARFDREDRLRKIMLGNEFTLPRLGMGLSQSNAQNQFNLQQNWQQLARWKALLADHNQGFDWTWGQIVKPAGKALMT
jgi:hypothetical protein